MTQSDDVRTAFADQAVWCAKLGSPFTARLMEALGPALDTSTETGRTVLGWSGPPDAFGDAVPLRLAGALHSLVRQGRLPALAALYPPNPLSGVDALAEAALAAIAEADGDIVPWLAFAPQTNEVARAAVLHAGLLVIAEETGLPLRLYEIGASAGLNLNLDRFAYRYGNAASGAPGSGVYLAPAWDGPPPPLAAPLRIVERRGCDLNPVDVTDPAARDRLVGYVWADQSERLARAEAAIAIACAHPPALDRAPAHEWIDRVVASAPAEGCVRVLMHSIAFQYFPEPAKQAITERMAALGAAATDRSPLAWLSFEQRGDQGPYLSLRLWPWGEERLLARADAHVRKVSWLA